MSETLKDVFHRIEAKWQNYWQTNECFRAANPGEAGSEKPKFYCLDMFPYPSGDGLHVGHPLGYIATDILRRYKKMRGFNVLHPMGWDAFGLPAEQYAIQKGIHPSEVVKTNIGTYKRQLQALGNAYDWRREVNTTDPQYYRWTQWIFKKLYEQGLAYQAEIAVNWCAALGTVLANDEVIDGKSERGGHPVVRRPMRQWMLKITSYAERLLQDLDALDWQESTKELQRNWIGKSEGARVRFALAESPQENLEVFTTRPDTLLGVTFMVIAPEHPLLARLTTPAQQSVVDAYVKLSAAKSDLQRTELNPDKSGVFTGGFVLHPLSGEKIPVWTGDYVLPNYGTGAVMAVPAHDERDAAFAQKFLLPVKIVIDDEGKIQNSAGAGFDFNGLPFAEGARKITDFLAAHGQGEKSITYRLRDWVFSRQRYWGEPIPVVHIMNGPEAGKVRLLNDDELPLELPLVDRYQPSGTGESPLVGVPEWINTVEADGSTGRRESNTMPGSAGSSWYYLRYMDARNDQEAWSKKSEAYWGPVDLYIGGQEHAVGHLLYARFWHKVFFDLGLVTHPEPFQKLIHQGMMLGEDGEKMSKSRGNVVNPDTVIREYGADTFRLFEMFLGPVEKTKPWQTANIEGVYRFLGKYWRFCTGEASENGATTTSHLNPLIGDWDEAEWPKNLRVLFHKSIQQITQDIEKLSMNTAISTLMILINEFSSEAQRSQRISRQFLTTFNKLLAPFAPHLAEEVSLLLGGTGSISAQPWPTFEAQWTVSDEIEIAVQINGKVRDQVKVAREIAEADLRELVLARESVARWMDGKALKKFIYVKGKLVSIVV